MRSTVIKKREMVLLKTECASRKIYLSLEITKLQKYLKQEQVLTQLLMVKRQPRERIVLTQ